MKSRAFTLVEVIIVVTILAILAAIAMPRFTESATRAKESAAKDLLHILRTQIELYKFDHSGTAPGYIMGSVPAPVTALYNQFRGTSKADGSAVASRVPVDPYIYGPYINEIPTNPFNSLSNIKIVANGTDIASAADGTTSGWIYIRETAKVALNWPGSDSEGKNHYEY